MISNIIAIGLSPNSERDDALRALTMMLTPWRWKQGTWQKKVEEWFATTFSTPEAVAFNSGRSACLALLQALEIGPGDEVIIQAFTCVAVADPILWAGATVRYADIDADYNIDPSSIEKCITDKTKAIIVQHTFGRPAEMYTIKKIAQKHKLFLIEDCCHALGAAYDGKRVGTWGDAAFFSFGRDKVVSSVFGGMAILHQQPPRVRQSLRRLQTALPYPPLFWIFQQLLHPIASAVILPTYSIGIGKILLRSLQVLGLLSFPVYPEEKSGGKPALFPSRFPDGLAYLAFKQLQKLERFNNRRREIAAFYARELSAYNRLSFSPFSSDSIYLRFTLQTPDRDVLLKQAKRRGILLGNWYAQVIDPAGVVYETIGYRRGSCPNAETAAAGCLNLPTYPRMTPDDMGRVVACVKDFYDHSRTA